MADELPPLDIEGMDPATATAVAARTAPKLMQVQSAEDYEKVPHGRAYLDPEGKQRFKPLRTKEDYETIGEGEEYADPQGNIRTKPKYEGIGFTSQTLYDIAHSDKGRRMALEKFYPGKVKEDPSGELYVDDEGKLRKPGRGIAAGAGFAAAETIPMILAGLGAGLGGAAGTLAEPGGGTIVGGAAGAYGGGYMGQRINDIFAQLAGVYDPEGAEVNARMSGAFSAAGDVGGRALFAAAPAFKQAAKAVGKGAAKTTAKFLGASAEKLETAVPIAEAGEEPGPGFSPRHPFGRLAKPGTAVSPSAIFESAPHVTNVAEILQQKFDRSDTYLANAERFMDKRAKQILADKDIGSIVTDSLVHPKAAVATEEAGKVLQDSAKLRAINESVEADKKLAEVLANRRAATAEDYDPLITRKQNLIKTAEDAKEKADNLVQQGFRDIEKQADDAIRVARVGHNAGDLWRMVAESFVALRRSIGARANQMYTDAETASGGLVPPNQGALRAVARNLMDELPEGFGQMHPTIVRRLADLANEEAPTEATWVQLHNLRSQIRQDIKWNDLPSDIRNGTLKFLERHINDVLHDVENQPELQEASRLLRLADDFYRENMGPLNNQQIKALVKALDSGLQADPKALLKMAIRDGKTEVANTIRDTVGPATWDAMRAADVKEMLAQSLQNDGSIDGMQFAKQVRDRLQNGVLAVLHGESGAARLQQQALYIEQLRGKLPIQPRPGDTANDIILRARAAVADVEKQAKEDPLKLMQNEMKKVEAATKKEFAATRKPDQLAFLTNSTVGAHEAVNKILDDPDLIMAAARAFPGGEKSPEFNLIRQIWAERFLRTTLQPGKKLSAVSPEIQALMFPGVTLDDMHMLAKEMELLMSGATMRRTGGDVGGSIMAQSAVENPLGRASGLGKLAGPVKVLPVVNPAARAVLTAYYNTIRGVLTSPSTLRWLRNGLKSRDPVARDTARRELFAALQKGGVIGAGVSRGAEGFMQEQPEGVNP